MPTVVALVDDLMFLSRIREAAKAAGVDVRAVRRLPELLAACRPAPRVVLVDLDRPQVPVEETLAALRSDAELASVPVVGFLSHVNADRAQAARGAGCTQVLARSAFVKALPSLLGLSLPSEHPPS
jgi:CheY-like chemotaxis protein